jgi:hypothetical protein
MNWKHVEGNGRRTMKGTILASASTDRSNSLTRLETPLLGAH